MVLSIKTSQSLEASHPQLESTLSGQLLDGKKPESFFKSFWYELKYISAGYQKYRRKEFSLLAFIVLQALTSLYFVYNDLTIFYDFPETTWGHVNIGVNVASVALGWLLACYYIVKKCRIDAPFWKVTPFWNRLEHCWVLLVSVAILMHIGYLAHFTAEKGQQNIYTPKAGTMPEASMVASMILPTMLYMVVKGTTLRIICVSWVMLFVVNFFLMVYFDLLHSMKTFIILMPFSFFLLLEFHRQNWASFALTEKLQRLIIENKRMSEEINASELRHMIGNVAHDLKTPLTSFVTGIDVVGSAVSEIRNLMSSITHEHSTYIFSKLKTIGQVSKDMTNTNTFMMMTINRCLEYNQSMHGLKLMPKIEKVSIKEAVSFPMSCMKNWDTKTKIELSPIGNDIFPFVFTDKQWLQENLLSLLANAVKYSKKGTITVRVSLEKLLIPVEAVLELDDCESDKTDIGMHGSIKMSTVVPFNGDDDRLDQFVSNIKQKEMSFVKFEVIDTGPGMSMKDMQIFDDPKHAARLTGGTGLGLYSLARRMESLNGAYGVHPRSDGEQGSIFWFSVPYKPFSRNTRKSATFAEESMSVMSVASTNSKSMSISIPSVLANQMAPSDTIQWTTPLRILVVDDSIVIVKTACTLLQREGHTVFTAANGLEGVSTIRQSLEGELPPIDVVLMDFKMPVMGGIEAVREIRMLERALPVSAMRLKEDAIERSHRSSHSDNLSGRSIPIKSPKHRNNRKDEMCVVSLEDENSKSFSFSAKDKYLEKPKPLKASAMDSSGHSDRNDQVYSSTTRRYVRHYVIGFSTKSEEDLVTEGFAAGIDAYMAKPFTLQAFNETMMKLIHSGTHDTKVSKHGDKGVAFQRIT